MQSLNNLLLVCYSFKRGKYDVEEFQSRILTAAIPDNLSKSYMDKLIDFDNQMEEILFCKVPLSRKEYADKVADELIQTTLAEQSRLNQIRNNKTGV